jgi:hypothetical protein
MNAGCLITALSRGRVLFSGTVDLGDRDDLSLAFDLPKLPKIRKLVKLFYDCPNASYRTYARVSARAHDYILD